MTKRSDCVYSALPEKDKNGLVSLYLSIFFLF